MFTGFAKHSMVVRYAALAVTFALLVVLAGALSGCNLLALKRVGTAGPPSVLQCGQASVGHGVDVVNMKVTCQASGAAKGDTSFQLHYTLKDGNGHTRTFDATCTGTLVNGAGTCTQTYALVVPFDSGSPMVSGEFLPSHKSLGPMELPVGNA